MTLFDANEVAHLYRKKLPKQNNFNYQELVNHPKLFDWVNCEVSENICFQMFLANDDGVSLRFFWNGFYEKLAIKVWINLSQKCRVILDVGAHTGAYTLAALKSNPNAIVASFEPYFMNFARLNLNLRGNGFDTQNAFMLAISSENSEVNFDVPQSYDYLFSGGKINNSANKGLIVSAVRIDDFFSNSSIDKVDLIKLDVEGHEFSCMEGAKKIITTSRPIILFECTSLNSKSILDELFHNYSLFVVDELTGNLTREFELIPYFDNQGKIDMNKINRLLMPNEKISWIE